MTSTSKSNRKKVCYLSGRIIDVGRKGQIWKEIIKNSLKGEIDFRDPMRHDFDPTDDGLTEKIIRNDLKDIEESDFIIAFYDAPSVGSSMEVFYAHRIKRIPVLVLTTLPPEKRSAWMKGHAMKIFYIPYHMNAPENLISYIKRELL